MNAHEDTRREFLKAVAGVGARELERPSPFI
jgi:hypothetical protein